MSRAKHAHQAAVERPHVKGAELKKLREGMPDESTLVILAEFFGIFGDTTRLKLLSLLAVADLCVQDIAGSLGMTQSAISHQLRLLKQARLVKHRRSGRLMFYSLDDDHVKQVFSQGLDHIRELRKGA